MFGSGEIEHGPYPNSIKLILSLASLTLTLIAAIDKFVEVA